MFTLSYIILLQYYNVHTVRSDMFSLSAVQDSGARYNRIVLCMSNIIYLLFHFCLCDDVVVTRGPRRWKIKTKQNIDAKRCTLGYCWKYVHLRNHKIIVKRQIESLKT